MYNNYMQNGWQYPGQSQSQQPFMQQQQQLMQQQFQQVPQQQTQWLKGRIVSSLDEVRAIPVDMDGSETYFPCPAENGIFTKSIDMNGNQIIHKYILDKPNNKNDITMTNLDKRVKYLEEMLEGLTGGNSTNESNSDVTTNSKFR